jgi:molybdopterin/thiamine biosynthesis adenylyltransferase
MKPVSPVIPDNRRRPLSEEERVRYEWQFPVAGVGEAAQERLKAATVLISRCGGLGGSVAYQLAAAGVGRLILAHGGNIRSNDLNRQILMTHEAIGTLRVESAARRLRELNPWLEVTAVAENVNETNAASLVREADVVVDCAPLFGERYLMNREAVRQGRPMVEAAVYELEAHLTTFVPGETPCLRCLYPETSTTWTRRFPVFGAVSASVGGLAAMEVLKLLTGAGEPLKGVLLQCDLRDMTFRRFRIRRDPHCAECSTLP